MSGARRRIRTPRSGSLMLIGGIGLAIAASACSYAGEEDVANQLDQLREEMRQGDQDNSEAIDQVGNRVDDLEGRIESIEGELESLEQEFNTTVERLEAALRFSTPIHFAFDEAEIPMDGQDFLDRFSDVVGEYYPDATVTVEGFTDPAGSADYNQRLGQQRADAVRGYLVDQGLDGNRVRAVSYGESQNRLIEPGATGPGEAGMSNRRVSLVVDYVPGPGGGLAPAAPPVSEGSASF